MGGSSQHQHSSLDPLSNSLSKYDCHHSGRHSIGKNSICENNISKHSVSKKTDDKKTQAQRLLEFEMWTNEKTLKELEYSQRRSEKKQRRREQRKFARHRVWKKLYLPGVLAMVIGTFLTLAATLQSLGEGTYLWDVRGVLIVLGPVLLALGFIILMLAAACTFKHDQMVKANPIGPPAEFLLLGLDLKNGFQDNHTYLNHRRSSSRGMSVDTTDMPLPEDLDPHNHFMDNGLQRSCRTRGSSFRSLRSHCSAGSHRHCHHSTDYGDQDGYITGQYSSTASWVRCVSASHRPQSSALKRQNSDSNLITSSSSSALLGYHHPDPLPVTATSASSHSDLPQQLVASFTSSGYQSANSLKGAQDFSSPIDVQKHQHHHHHHHHKHHHSQQQEGGHNHTNTSLSFTTTTSTSTAASSKPSQSLSSPSNSKGNPSAKITIVKEGRSNRPHHQHFTYDLPSVHETRHPKLSNYHKGRGLENALTSPKSIHVTNELSMQSHMEAAPADHNQNDLRQNVCTQVAPGTPENSKITTNNGFSVSSISHLGHGENNVPSKTGYLVNDNKIHASLPRTGELHTALVYKEATVNEDNSTVKQTNTTTIKQTGPTISQNGHVSGITIVDIESHTVNERDSVVRQNETADLQNGNAAVAHNPTTIVQNGSLGHSPETITSTSPTIARSTVCTSSSEQSNALVKAGHMCRVERDAKCGQQQADDTSNVMCIQQHKLCLTTNALCTDI